LPAAERDGRRAAGRAARFGDGLTVCHHGSRSRRAGAAGLIAALSLGACIKSTTDAQTHGGSRSASLVRTFEALPVWGTSETSALHIDGYPSVSVSPCAPPNTGEVRFSPDKTRVALGCNGALWTIVDLHADGGLQTREWARDDLGWKDIWAAPTPTEAPQP
jgi:hypothetical protein